MIRTRRAILASVGALSLSYALPSIAQRGFASRPLRIVVPFAPGGSNDSIARLIAPKLQELLGQTVVIDNKGGAGGAIGAQAVARSDPDGHTVLFHSNSLIIQPHLVKNPGYDVRGDFTPVSLLAQAPLVLVVHPSVPATTFAEFLKYARAKGAGLFYGSAGMGAAQHLVGELFNNMAGTKMKHIPYKGSGPAVAAVMAGEIEATFDIIPSARSLAQSGKVRLLAVTSKTRNPTLPQLPSIHESGVPNFEFNFWQAISLPKATPTTIVDQWRAALQKVLEAKDIQARLTEQGYEIMGSSPTQMADVMQRESEQWAKVIVNAHIRIDS